MRHHYRSLFAPKQPDNPDPNAFAQYLAPLHKCEWVVYAKPPFGGPESVLAYLSRYTHRVAISNSRLISADANAVTFKWKDYRVKNSNRQKTMRLTTGEFIRRFLIHVLPNGFHRIRHYGLLADLLNLDENVTYGVDELLARADRNVANAKSMSQKLESC